MIVAMRLDALILDPRTQPRAEIDYALVADYHEDMERGDTFPPVVAWGSEERAYLSSGWHRYKAQQQLGADQIEVDLREGTLEDAIWDSLSTNGEHGKRRSNKDKWRAVAHALELRPSLSDGAIAEHCHVSQPFVGKVRANSTHNGYESNQRLGSDGRVYEVKSRGYQPFYETPTAITPATVRDDLDDERGAEVLAEIEDADDSGSIARARLRLQFSRGVSASRDLIMLRADAVADVLTTDQAPAVEAFCIDMRAWCEQLEAAIHRPIRVLGGSNAT